MTRTQTRLIGCAIAGLVIVGGSQGHDAVSAAGQDTLSSGLVSPLLLDLNQRLAGGNLEIEKVEFQVDAARWNGSAIEIYARDHTHTLPSQFVPNDLRRTWSLPNSITYLADQSDGEAYLLHGILPNAITEAAIDRSMARWQSQPSCPGPAVVKVADSGADPDIMDGLVFRNRALVGTPFADITHAGWVDPAFFGDGFDYVVAATVTFIFVDDVTRRPTDIDRNGRYDVAVREIYYNKWFAFADGAVPFSANLDSIITHEAGHGFGLGHFGMTFSNGPLQPDFSNLKFAPLAVMNALYVAGTIRADLEGTDISSFCQIWARAH